MALNIPDSVFDKYYEVIDSTFDIFGVPCQLVTIDKEEVTVPDNNIPPINSINDHRRNTGGTRGRGTVIIREVEVFTDINLKVYWDSKQWVQVTESLVAPNAAIQTIAFMKDLQQVLSATALIVQKGVPDAMEMKFERVGGHIPMGLKQNRYFACFWKRIS
jgi:hypothetical protein